MINRFRPLFVGLIVVGFAAFANAQQRGNAQARKAPPEVGAWCLQATGQLRDQLGGWHRATR